MWGRSIGLMKMSRALGENCEEGGVISQVLLRQTVRRKEGGREELLVTKQARIKSEMMY